MIKDLSFHLLSSEAENQSFPFFGIDVCRNDENDGQELAKSLLHVDDNMEETQKLAFLSSHVIDSVKAGGSVLIPISRLGIVLQLLEQISSSLDVSALKVDNIFYKF